MNPPAIPSKSPLPLNLPLPDKSTSTDRHTSTDDEGQVGNKSKGRLSKGQTALIASPRSPLNQDAQGGHQNRSDHRQHLHQDHQHHQNKPGHDYEHSALNNPIYPKPVSPVQQPTTTHLHHLPHQPIHAHAAVHSPPSQAPTSHPQIVYPTFTPSRPTHTHSDPASLITPPPFDPTIQPSQPSIPPTLGEPSPRLSHKLFLALKAKPTLTRTWEKKTFTEELQSAPLQLINHPNSDIHSPLSRPTSLYASPSAMRSFRPLPHTAPSSPTPPIPRS